DNSPHSFRDDFLAVGAAGHGCPPTVASPGSAVAHGRSSRRTAGPEGPHAFRAPQPSRIFRAGLVECARHGASNRGMARPDAPPSNASQSTCLGTGRIGPQQSIPELSNGRGARTTARSRRLLPYESFGFRVIARGPGRFAAAPVAFKFSTWPATFSRNSLQQR